MKRKLKFLTGPRDHWNKDKKKKRKRSLKKLLLNSQKRLEAEFLDKIQTNALRVFLFDFHSHLYGFA
jgi:hypothetical protein